MVCAKANVSYSQLRYGRGMEESAYKRLAIVKEELKRLPIFVEDERCGSLDEICSTIRFLKGKYKIELAIIDYLQLVNAGIGNGESKRTGSGCGEP